MRSKKYNRLYYLLRSVTGIGPLIAASLLTEIGDTHRLKIFTNSSIVYFGLLLMEPAVGTWSRKVE
ncbi:MAG: transposase [Chitinophagaceae bacterium]|nr:transposase [Chitinophagaceae bacterium]